MNIKSKTQEIETKVREIWHSEHYPYDPDNIEVRIEKSGKWVDIEISSQYNTPGCTFNQLTQLSQFFGTTRINQESDIHSEGCETCDYGSCYGFTLRILPPSKDEKPISQSTHGWFLTNE